MASFPSVDGGRRQVEFVHLASILKVLHMKGASNDLVRVKYTNDWSLNLLLHEDSTEENCFVPSH